MDRTSLLVDGQWTAGGDSTEVLEASTGKALGTAALATPADVDTAVAAARRALGPWSALAPVERSDALLRFAKALKARAKDTAALVSRENGMPISLSVGAEGFAPSMILSYYARLVRDLELEELRPSVFGGSTLVRREPVGVVAAITPWNYPQALASMKLGPALAAGCTVVLKAAPETALDAYVFADAALEAGLPPGVLNVVPGGREAGAHLVSHPGVDKVAFTGSTAAGRAIGEACGRLLRPVTLELGGKSAALLGEDVDLERFLGSLLSVCLPNNGQTCHSSARLLVPQARHDEVLDAVVDTVRALRVGDPLDPGTQIGPVATATQRERVLGLVERGVSEGARLVTGGSAPEGMDDGWFVAPTVLANVDNRSTIAQEEVFGPVLTVTPYRDEDHAVELANDSDYGLAGTVWTPDAERGLALARRIRSGTVGVNHYALDFHSPFGGLKSSGLGRELGPEGLGAYLDLVSVYLEPTPADAP